MNQYLGYDVLEAAADGRLSRVDVYDREFTIAGGVLGRRDVDETSAQPHVIRSYAWTCIGLTEVADMKAFVDRRRGRVVPFWLPSLEHDLELNGDHNAAHEFIDVKTLGYVELLYPFSGARRYLYFRKHAGDVAGFIRKVTGPINNLTGVDSLYLDAALGVTMNKADWMVSFLRFCRLDQDSIDIEFQARDYATATIRVRELPLEAPL